MNNIYKTLLVLWALTLSAFAQTGDNTKILYQFKDALWNQTAATAKDSGSPGGKDATVEGNGVTFVNNGVGGTAIQYSITSTDAKLTGLTADWGERFVLEARVKKSALDGNDSEIHILKNVVTTGLDWYIDTNNKMVLKVGDGSSINIISDTPVIGPDSWITLAAVVDLTKTDINEAVKFFINEGEVSSGGSSTPAAINQVVFDEAFTGRNFNTDPLVIDNLQGDSFDYTFVINFDTPASNSELQILFNGDSGNNYRRYYMSGQSSTTSAGSDDSIDTILRNTIRTNNPSLVIGQIKGKSGAERIIDALQASGSRIQKFSSYWKNTTDEINSVTFSTVSNQNYTSHIRVYATPKAATTNTWEFVEEVSFSNISSGTEHTLFSGLDGNTDKKYRIDLKYTESGGSNPGWRFNADASNNYNYQILRNNSSSISSTGSSSNKMLWSGGHNPTDANLTTIINAESGQKRLISQTLSDIGNVNGDQAEMAGWWNDDTNNLTSISFIGANNATGTARLYKLKDPAGVADKYNLPFEVVETVDINGDFSAGHTFSNLTGDSEFMYKVEFLGESSSTTMNLKMLINNDSGANYEHQYLITNAGSVSAGSASASDLAINAVRDSTAAFSEIYIYPKSGKNRSILVNGGEREKFTLNRAYWWTNTTDEITSIKAFSTTSENVTGKLILSKIPLSVSQESGQQQQQGGTPVAGSAEKVFDETFTARNFNTDPLTIDDLEGDTYDYDLIVTYKSGYTVNASDSLSLRINNDSGSNYRQYRMLGSGSSALASVSETDSSLRITAGNNSSPIQFNMTRITGVTGEERHLDVFFAASSVAASHTRLAEKNSCYWKNTVDELTSLTFTGLRSVNSEAHVILYRTPKVGNQGNWEFVDELAWNNESVEKSFSGLDGDNDKQYKLVWEGSGTMSFRLNSDSSVSYIHQSLLNNGGSLTSVNETLNEVEGQRVNTGTSHQNGEWVIHAQSGTKRLITSDYSENTSSGYEKQNSAIWWNNTTGNINTIDLNALSKTLTGSVKLYKLKDTSGTDGTLNWETIETLEINGDFSAGHSFSGLTGDSETLYKVEWLGANTSAASILEMQINDDSSNNYQEQRLRANNATASAATVNNPYLILSTPQNGEVSSGEMFLYPKSGSYRPILSSFSNDEDQSDYRSGWWENSTDEITSIKVFSSNTNALNGTLKLSRLIESVTEPISGSDISVGPVALAASSTYTTGIYSSISGENAIEVLSKTGAFSLESDFVKMTLKRPDEEFDTTNFQKSEGYKVDENYNLTGTTSSSIYIYPPKLLRRVNNPPTDFDNLGLPKDGVTVDIDNGSGGKVFYGVFQFEFALSQAISENVTVDVFMKTGDFDFKKVAEVKPTPKPADAETPWVIRHYWNARATQFDWDGNAYKTTGAVQFKLEVR